MFSIQHHIHFHLYIVNCNHLHLDPKISFGKENIVYMMYFFYCVLMNDDFMAL